jgi:GT2 family glycosyltransferase
MVQSPDMPAAADDGAGLDALPRVSVIVAVRNEAEWIEGCLDALACQTYSRERTELILVDGRSDDGTVERARSWATSRDMALRIVDNPGRLTPAGFNRGLAAASGEVIVILGARARPAPDFLEASVAALVRTGADAVGGVVETVPSTVGRVARAVALAQRSPFGVGDAGYRYAEREGETDTVNYGAYRRDVFRRIGGFDEALQWVEDDELNYRLRKAGGRLVLDPAIRVRYLARPTLGALWRQRYRWGFNKPRVARQHPGQMRPRHAVPAAFVLALAGGALLAARGGRARRPLVALVGAYGAASLVASVRLALRAGRVADVALLPAAFATMHVAYGVGTLAGLRALLRRGAPSPGPPSLRSEPLPP